MVDAGHPRPHRLMGLPQGDGKVEGPVPHLVTETDRLNCGLPADRPGEAGHRVGDVEHPGVRADSLHVLGDPDQHGDVAEGPVDPAGADGVPHRLADAVPGRHLQIDGHRVESPGGDGHDHEVGSLECSSLIGGGGERGLGSQGLVDHLTQRLHLGQRCRVDVLEHDVDAAQRRRGEQIGEELGGPLIAAAADDGDLHGAQSRSPTTRDPPDMGVTLSTARPPHRGRSQALDTAGQTQGQVEDGRFSPWPGQPGGTCQWTRSVLRATPISAWPHPPNWVSSALPA